MKKITYRLFIVAIIGFTSCQKQEVVPPPANTSELSTYFSENESNAIQTFTMDASTNQNFIGSNGVRLGIPANSFIDSDGTPVTGNITIELIEVLDIASMIKLQKSTTSNNEILVSGGQLKLSAYQNSSEIFLKPSAGINISVPTSNPDPQMALFTGEDTEDSDVLWTSSLQDPAQQDSISIVQDTASFTYFYNFIFDSDSLGWINCDHWPVATQPRTMIQVQLDTLFTIDNTRCFGVFEDYNSVVNMKSHHTPGLFLAFGVPINQHVTFACLSEINGNYYSAFISNTVETDHFENVIMSQTTLVEIEAEIDNL